MRHTKRLLDNQGFITIMNTITAMVIGTMWMMTQQAIQKVEQIQIANSANVETAKNVLAQPQVLTPLVSGQDLDTFAPFSVAVPVPGSLSNVSGMTLNFTGPNTSLGSGLFVAPATLEVATQYQSANRIARQAVLVNLYVDSGNVVQSARLAGGRNTAQEMCSTTQGEWDNNLSVCKYLGRLGIEASNTAFMAYTALDGSLVSTLDRFRIEVRKSFEEQVALRLSLLGAALNDSNLDQSSKDAVNLVIGDLIDDYNTHAGLDNLLDSIEPGMQDMRNQMGGWWFAQRNLARNNQPRLPVLQFAEYDMVTGIQLDAAAANNLATNTAFPVIDTSNISTIPHD